MTMVLYYLMDLERTLSTGVPYFWKNNKRGYTYDIQEAGLYQKKSAEAITKGDLDKRTVLIPLDTVADILNWKQEKV